jgi:ubiquinone/menaquinone biosynthesis C-methylase UbiE
MLKVNVHAITSQWSFLQFYGCGNPIPLGIEGKRVLDLGSGSGRDCYIAAALVGETGEVTGVDMTDEQLQVARANMPAFAKSLGYTPNISFVKGYIEALQGKAYNDPRARSNY